MATKRSDINTINFLESRQVLKNLNVIKAKGLKVREPIKVEDANGKEVDENVYAKSKSNNFIKANQKSLLLAIPSKKPAFSVYCDDDCNDECNSEASEFKAKDATSEDCSTLDESCSGNPLISKMIGQQNYGCSDDKNEDYNEKIITDENTSISSLNNEAELFHSSNFISNQTNACSKERLSCHSDYDRDIYLYMCQRERDLSADSQYLHKQPDISSEMRYILIDWLTDVSWEYKLSLESLHLAVSIIDRTLSRLLCPRLKLQLIGVTAIMIATKFEEVSPPRLEEFVNITDETYSGDQILRMEKVILNTLCFEISTPTANWYGARLASLTCSEEQTSSLLNYLLELALLDYRYLQYRSSVIACAAFCLANVMTGNTAWSSSLEHDTEVSLKEMKEPLHDLLTSFTKAPNSEYKVVYEKYKTVASLVPPSCLPI